MYPKDIPLVGDSTQIHSLFDVRGKVVLVTGGARGIGLMIAHGFIVNGAKVIISSRSSQMCDAAVKELNKLGKGVCYSIPADLSKEEECKRVANEIETKEGYLDVLVNNAGANWGEPLETYPNSAWDKVLALNLKSIFFLTRALVPLLEQSYVKSNAQTPAKVINIGSIDGIRVPNLETYAYSASKAGVHHLTRTLALRLAPSITVNAIAAGGFETKMMAATLEKFRDAITAAIPMGRLGTPGDISALSLFLASNGGNWATGGVFTLDGGALLGSKL